MITKKEIEFKDGSKIVIEVIPADDKPVSSADGIYRNQFQLVIEDIEHDMAIMNGICCTKMQNAMNKPTYYPAIMYLPRSKWKKDGKNCIGATGPGFYKIYKLQTEATHGEFGLSTIDDVTAMIYMPLTFCPFCHTKLHGVEPIK